jgi:hypothetical protein
MYDMLEGILSLILFNLLLRLIQENILLISEVAARLQYFEYGKIDSNSGKVPYSFFTSQRLSNTKLFGFTASHFRTDTNISFNI